MLDIINLLKYFNEQEMSAAESKRFNEDTKFSAFSKVKFCGQK